MPFRIGDFLQEWIKFKIDTNQLDEITNKIRQAIYLAGRVTCHWELSKRSAASDESETDIDRWL